MELDRVPPIAKYLSVTFLLAWIGRSTVWNFLPIYFETHISSVFLIGIVVSLPSAIPLLLDIPVGNLVQRAGEKITIFLGLIATIVPGALYYTAVPVFLVLGKAVEGLAKTFIWNGGWSISMKSSSDDIESESLSVFLLGTNLALVVGPIIGGYLIASRGFPVTFGLWVFSAALAVIVFYSYIGIHRKRGLIDSVEDLFHRRTYRDDWHHIKDNWPALKFPLTLIFLQSIIFSFYWLALPLMLKEVGAGFEMMGLIFGIAAIPKTFQFVFGDLADHVGRLKMMAILSALLTPVMIAMSFQDKIIVVGVLFFIARTLSSGMSPAMHALFDSRCPEKLEGELTGFLEFCKHFGQTLGPIIAGTVASIWSINTSFLAAGTISAMILGVVVHHYYSER